jgi:transposase InsO family protein
VDKGLFLIERHLKEGTPIAELAAAIGMHRSWLYKLLARYEAEGEPGLVPRSRRPHRSPARISDLFEVETVRLRKSLADAGWDAGPETIHDHLAQRHRQVPSVSTIWRVLRARGFVTPQPHKRPRSSYVRFAAELPNECWQMDTTHVHLADGSDVEILNVIDDHSRLCVGARARSVYTATDVAAVFSHSIDRFGTPAAVLSDNGAIFTAAYRFGVGALEAELAASGIDFKHSRPYHPQTCGKVERFHQTMKKYLHRQRPPKSLGALQAQIDRFVEYYNTVALPRVPSTSDSRKSSSCELEGPATRFRGQTRRGDEGHQTDRRRASDRHGHLRRRDIRGGKHDRGFDCPMRFRVRVHVEEFRLPELPVGREHKRIVCGQCLQRPK